jgi:PKD repeat protein
MDDDSDLSTVASRTFTVSVPGTITAEFIGTPLSGTAPLDVPFTDLSTATNGIDTWSWDFGDSGTSSAQHPSCSYMNAGSYTVSLTVTGPDGSDTGTKTNYVTVGGGSLGPDYIWTKRMGASNPDKATDICVDGSDNVYVVGTFCDTVNFAEDWGGTDEETSAGTWDVFVTKIDSNDSYCWTRRIGGPNSDEVHSVCTGAGGSVYITGMFEGTVDFATGWGGNDPKTSVHQDDIYVTKVDASGSYAWTRTIGGQFGQNAYSICSDGTGNIYVAGNFYGTVNFAADWGGSDEKTGAGNGDIFVTRINSDGTYGWTRFMGSGTADAAHGVCADESDNIYIAGRFTGTVNFASDWSGNDTKTSVRTYDIFITRINSDGSYGWTHIMGDWGDDRALAVCSAGNGHIVQAGYFEGTTVNFAADWGGDDTKANAGSTFDGDVFITKVYAGGTYGWTHRIGGTDGDRANDICVDPAGDTYVTGYFQQTVNFGEDWSGLDEKSSAGGSDIFLTKVRNNGSYAWTRRAGSTEWDHAYAVCTNSSGQIYVAGCFSGTVNFAEDWGSTDAKISAGSSDIFIMKVGPSISRSWVEKFPANRPPSWQYPALTYDSSRGVVVLFGGDNGALLNDTWEYDGTNWVQRSPANKPSARRDYSVAYDSTRGVVVLFGGWGGVRLDDTWEYNGTDWVQRSTATTLYARSTHAAAYDSSRSVVVIFGGTDGSRFDDTWEYDGTDWVEVNSASRPSRRYGHSIAFDSGRAMIILFGGWDNSGRCNDTWEYNGTNWALKDPADTPPSRYHHSMVYDSSLSVTVLFGGSSSSGNLDDTWEY